MEGRVCPGDRNRTGSLLCRHQVSLVDLGKYNLIIDNNVVSTSIMNAKRKAG